MILESFGISLIKYFLLESVSLDTVRACLNSVITRADWKRLESLSVLDLFCEVVRLEVDFLPHSVDIYKFAELYVFPLFLCLYLLGYFLYVVVFTTNLMLVCLFIG